MSWAGRLVGSVAGAPDLGDDLGARLADAVAATNEPGGFRWEKTLTMPGPRGDRPLRRSSARSSPDRVTSIHRLALTPERRA